LVYDLLYEGVETLLPLPFLQRRARLERWIENAEPPIVLHESRPLVIGDSKDAALDAEFDAARARGHEGLVLKRLDAPYAAGVRGFSWLKVKKALATLDVVIVAAERGHGKRAGVLSDYTFSVRAGSELATIGKAYSGLTDAEIAQLTERLEAIAVAPEKRGYLPVRPEIVLEVGFDGLQRSQRHSSGFALRFPRIMRIRDDKTPEDIDTIDAVQAIWDAQLATGHREEAAGKRPKSRGRKSGYKPDTRQKSKQLKLFDD
jgi:DNA ligase-1